MTNILTQADVVRAASLTRTPTADEWLKIAEIQAAVDVVVEHEVGPVLTQTKTYTGRCRMGAIVLPWPYVSITSVTVDGTVLDPSTYDTEQSHEGLLRAAYDYARNSSVGMVRNYSPWAYGMRVTVVAVTGSATALGNVKLAAMALARHWWQLDQNGGRGAWADENGQPLDVSMPRIVRQQLAATQPLPGFG